MFMDENQKNSEKNKSSLKEIITKPVFKVDSKVAQYSGLGITLAGCNPDFFLDRQMDRRKI